MAELVISASNILTSIQDLKMLVRLSAALIPTLMPEYSAVLGFTPTPPSITSSDSFIFCSEEVELLLICCRLFLLVLLFRSEQRNDPKQSS